MAEEMTDDIHTCGPFCVRPECMARRWEEAPHCPTCHCGATCPACDKLLADLRIVFRALRYEEDMWLFSGSADVEGLDDAFDRLHKTATAAKDECHG